MWSTMKKLVKERTRSWKGPAKWISSTPLSPRMGMKGGLMVGADGEVKARLRPMHFILFYFILFYFIFL